jgi:hypothetical protein
LLGGHFSQPLVALDLVVLASLFKNVIE